MRIYENDSTLIALRRESPVAATSLANIKSYFKTRNIPFDDEHGFVPPIAFSANSDWYVAQLEAADWGWWPHPAIKQEWAMAKARYFARYQLPLQRLP
jgi:hypothetical protein